MYISSSVSSYYKDTAERFMLHKMAVAGLLCLVVLILCVIFLPMIFPLDPYNSFVQGGFNQRPGSLHWLGTDRTGRDIFARLIYGGRISLSIGILSAVISLGIGVPLGLIAGYWRGFAETIVMRMADVFMSFPAMVLILVLAALVGTSIYSITLVIGVLGWTQFARLLYSKVLSIRENEYIESARAVGAGPFRILTKYVLPNAFAPCLVVFTFRTAVAILLEAGLSFLGLGVQPPLASWGNLMYDAQSIVVLSAQPWSWLPPGLCLVITVLSINFIGDGLRDALDPKMHV